MGEAKGAYEDGLALGDDVIACEAAMMQGYCHLNEGRIEEAGTMFEEALERSASGVSDFIHALSMSIKGMLLFLSGDVEAGVTLTLEARKIQERLGDCEGGGVALSFLAQMTSAKGDAAGAVAYYREALEAFEQVGDTPEVARVHCEMGWAALSGSDAPAARESFRRAVQTYEVVGSPRGTGLALLGLAAVEAAEGRSENAVAIAAAADALSKRAGVVVDHPMDPGVVNRIEALKAGIPKGRLDGLVEGAKGLSVAEVLKLVGE